MSLSRTRRIERSSRRPRTLGATAALLVLALGGGAYADSSAPTKRLPDAYLEIRSALERPNDLVELIVPFLARLNFAAESRSTAEDLNSVSAIFRNLNGDAIGVGGRPSCIVLGFYATRHPPSTVTMGWADRTSKFSAQLKDFLDGLPTPRPALRSVISDAGGLCRDTSRRSTGRP